jgi:hypothetical protein
MAGRIPSILLKDPQGLASSRPKLLQLLDRAGHVNFPARKFGIRTAEKLLKRTIDRVFLDALDGNWRVTMSKAIAPGTPNHGSQQHLFSGYLCIPPSEILTPIHTRSTWIKSSPGSRTRMHEPRYATGVREGSLLHCAFAEAATVDRGIFSRRGGPVPSHVLPSIAAQCRPYQHKRGMTSCR